MRFFKIDEAEKHHREGLRHRDPGRKEFDIGLALEHLREAVMLKPYNARYHYDLGHTYLAVPMLAITRKVEVKFKLEDSAKMALQEIEEALRLKPGFTEAYQSLGLAYEYLGAKQDALSAYRTIEKMRTFRMMKQWAQGRVHILEGQVKAAVTPDKLEAKKHLRQAMAYRDEGDLRRADEEFMQACQLAPDSEWLYRTASELASQRTSYRF